MKKISKIIKMIQISFNDDKIKKIINLNSKWKNDKNLDFTKIEIKPKIDGLNEFLEIDEHLELVEKNIPIKFLNIKLEQNLLIQ